MKINVPARMIQSIISILREIFHYKVEEDDIGSVSQQYHGIGFFPGIFFRLFHYLPIDTILAKSLKAPGTPSGNCLKKLNPV